jgi:MFS family permease
VTGSLRRYARSFTGFERDARIFLVATLVYGVMLSLWWVDFNLYLAALGFDNAFIGIVGTASAAAAALAAFPASLLSDRIGRRLVLVLATGVSAVGIVGLLIVGSSVAVIACAALIGGASCSRSRARSPPGSTWWRRWRAAPSRPWLPAWADSRPVTRGPTASC